MRTVVEVAETLAGTLARTLLTSLHRPQARQLDIARIRDARKRGDCDDRSVTPSPERAALPRPTFAIGGDLPVRRLGYGAMQITGPGVWGEPRDRWPPRR
jgi:hypothetical protein